MPGFAGTVSERGTERIQTDIHIMAAALLNRAGGQLCPRIDLGAGLASTELAEKGGRRLALAGLVVPDPVLQRRLDALPECPPAGSPADRLLALYLAGGIEALTGLNGTFAIAVWDGPARTLTLINDRSGVQPCYYWDAGGGRLAFSTEIKAIAALPDFPRAVDPAGLFDLVATGQMLGERTLFQGISALPPASVLTFTDECLEVRPYWRPLLYHSGSPPARAGDVIDQLAELVRAAAGRYLAAAPAGGAVCLLVTGGLDSRVLAGALARQDGRPSRGRLLANTIGHEQACDVLVGRQVARAAGLPHALIPADPRYLETYALECLLRTEGNMNLHAAWILQESRFLAENGVRAVMTGVGGETISGRFWLNEQRVTDPAKAVALLFDQHWQSPAAAQLLHPHLARAGQIAGREDAFRTLAQAQSDDPYARFDYLAYRQIYRHPTGNVLAEDALVLEPFFDNDLVEFAFRQSPREQIGGRIYQRMLERHFPRVSAAAKAGHTALFDPLAWLAVRAGRRIARHVPFLRPAPTGDHPTAAIYYNHWLRTASRSYITGLLNREDLLGDYFVMPRVRRLLDDHMTGRADAFRLIGALATFALWQEQFG